MPRLTAEEEEQLSALKNFWAKYGHIVLLVLIVVLGTFAARNGWQWWQGRQSAKAVVVYEGFEKALADSKLDLAASINTTLQDQHGSSAYPQRSALLLARAQANAGQFKEAAATLEWAVANAKLEEYATTARLLLSAVQVELGQLDAAKATVAKDVPAFQGLLHDRRGDIALAAKNLELAKQEFEAAKAALPENNPWRVVAERKLLALPSVKANGQVGGGS
jgi:predicted negative regulator of RcsB-dependent stress response